MSALLSSLNILDFSTLLPGPFASKTLADLGAEVLRVESTKHPDFTRSLPSNSKGGLNAHASLNRSKQSIGLNLKQADAVKIVKKLVNKYDIVLEQFRPGVMKRLGLDYQELRKYNQSLIFCSLTGYGQTGPYRNRAGHDLNYLAISGISNYSRRKNESPVPQGIQVADIAGGAYHVVIGILAAVIHRQLTGEGQYIDISMTDAMFSMNVFEGSNWLSGGSGAEPESTMLNGGTLYDYYKTQDGRWVSVSSLEPLFLNALIKALELPENLLNTSLDDQDAQKKLKEILKKRFLERPWSEWETVFANCDACVELVLEFPEAMQHQQFKAREMIVDIPDSSGSTQKQIASPFKFSSCKPEYRHAGVELGEQTDLVLKELGYTQKQINKLKKAGVCEDNKTG
ncbi:MAG: Succinyl-CoA--L-malate CoA-transferase beta subunit [Deltaproteobacteria bacterium]|jgi:crotonobetainyl-CoA:carnitine CoA-transferase CaiB-like acyl-CoA transferase|nr:Succinyl-CoA--L-malate CoA-transferase beta subunit [Deltaproteobacteria bacterium]